MTEKILLFLCSEKGMIDWEKAFRRSRLVSLVWYYTSLSLELAELCEEALEVASKMGLTISADLNYRHFMELWQKCQRNNAQFN